MDQNFLIELMCVWAVANFVVCLMFALFGFRQKLQIRMRRERMLKFSLILNFFASLMICGGLMSPFYLWGLIFLNVPVLVACLKIADYRYEGWLKTRKFNFRLMRVKHNIAHGEVEIDGKLYSAFIPPVWIKEYRDEYGNIIPGAYKSFGSLAEQRVRFKRFVCDCSGRQAVELG